MQLFRIFNISKISVPFKILVSVIRYYIPCTFFSNLFYQSSVLQLRKSPLDRRVGDFVSSKFQIYFEPLLVVSSAAFRQEFEDDIISSRHPWSPFSSWHTCWSIPTKLRSLKSITCGCISSHSDLISTQSYLIVGRYFPNITDATLVGSHYSRKTGCDPAFQARRRVGGSDMKDNALGHNNAVPHDQGESADDRREQLRDEIDQLNNPTTRRACRALVEIKQTHLSYYQ